MLDYEAEFANGHIAEALIGDGPYLMPNRLYDVHDRLGVANLLFHWAVRTGNQAAAGRAIDAAVQELIRQHRGKDALHVLHSVQVVDDRNGSTYPWFQQRLEQHLDEIEAIDPALSSNGAMKGLRSVIGDRGFER